jgi:hypothetical protein
LVGKPWFRTLRDYHHGCALGPMCTLNACEMSTWQDQQQVQSYSEQ